MRLSSSSSNEVEIAGDMGWSIKSLANRQRGQRVGNAGLKRERERVGGIPQFPSFLPWYRFGIFLAGQREGGRREGSALLLQPKCTHPLRGKRDHP